MSLCLVFVQASRISRPFGALTNGQCAELFNKFIYFCPNMAVKGTRRTQVLLKVGSLFGFVGFGLVLQPARPLPPR